MGQALHTLGIGSMSVEDRIALVQDIWDSVAIEAGLLLPSTAEKVELDRRWIEIYRNNVALTLGTLFNAGITTHNRVVRPPHQVVVRA